VRVDVNEPGRDDQAARVDRIATAYFFLREDGDSSIQNSDVASCVEIRRGINNPSAEDHAIVHGVH